MDGIEVRHVHKEEWAVVLDLSRICFGEEYSEDDSRAFFPGFASARSLGAFENGRLVGVISALPMELTLPGSVSVPMGGLTFVGVLPTHRRRGILTRLMRDQFDDMAARGELVSGLGASEGAIYGRYGYGPGTSGISFEVERPYARFRPAGNGAVGEHTSGIVSLLTREEAMEQIPPLYERLRLSQPGMTNRPESLWSGHFADSEHYRGGASRMYHVKHESREGVVDGYASYRLKDTWTKEAPMLEVRVVECMTADPEVYRSLWDYLLSTDLSHTISCERGRVDEPLRWLLADPRRFSVTALYDSLWLRLLDMPGALSARAYRRPGELVLEVHDPFPEPAVRNLRLQVAQAYTPGPPAVQCSVTSAPADLSLDAGTLSTVYLGGTSFASVAAVNRVQENTPGSVELADAIFSTAMAPFCSTDF